MLLSEALTGFRKVITTLDQRKLVIQTIPGEVIKHGERTREEHPALLDAATTRNSQVEAVGGGLVGWTAWVSNDE